MLMSAMHDSRVAVAWLLLGVPNLDRTLLAARCGLPYCYTPFAYSYVSYVIHTAGNGIEVLSSIALPRHLPADLAPAEEALRSAIAVAQRQGIRAFELRAAPSLAKLYQSTGRPADAHAVLGTGARRFRADAGNAGDRRGRR
jgi:hypothetical protein